MKIDVPDLDAAREETRDDRWPAGRRGETGPPEGESRCRCRGNAKANADEQALLRQARAEKLYRKQQYSRMAGLRETKAIDQNVVDEAARNLELAEATEMAATQSILKAQSQILGAKQI